MIATATDHRAGIAHHEAGHAVALEVLGGSVWQATVIPSSDSLGRMTPQGWHGATPTDRIAMLLAGPVAELIFLGRPDTDFPPGARTDLRQIDQQLATVYGKPVERSPCPEYQAGLTKARSILNGYWPAIEHLAGRLLTHSTVSGCLVRAILEIFEAKT